MKSRPTKDVARTLTAWFGREARELPWRLTDPATGRRDPYRVLVSEVMLQQTQVSRVIPAYGAFLRRFPNVRSLARAREQDVLNAWKGLGYYRRARMLHGAARAIVRDHEGAVPDNVAALRSLPGVGRYTAGAVASIAFGRAEPIVDGNVSRVLLRLHGKDIAPDSREGVAWTWDAAGSLVRTARDPGAFNEALMELGATICTPANPRCDACPVRSVCVACKDGTQDSIPRPKARAKRRTEWHITILARDGRGGVLLERNDTGGLWDGLWRTPTLTSTARPRSVGDTARALAARHGVRVEAGAPWRFVFKTTACDVGFVVYGARATRPLARGRWCTDAQRDRLAMSSPTMRIIREGG